MSPVNYELSNVHLITPSQRVDKLIFYFLCVFCIAFPGLGVLKAVCIISTFSYLLVFRGFNAKSGLWMISALLNLVIFAFIGIAHGFDQGSVFGHTSRLLLFMLMLAIGWYVSRQERKKSVHFDVDTIILSTVICMAMIKTVFALLVITEIFSFKELIDTFDLIAVTSGDIGFGLSRIQFPADIALIFLVACYRGGKSKALDVLLIISVTVIAYLSFSRYIFFAVAFSFIIRSIYVKKIDLIPMLCVIASLFLGYYLLDELRDRFFGSGSSDSDLTRIEQITYIAKTFWQNPFWGIGLGGHALGYIRSSVAPYSYEVQWYAMLMQMGIIGCSWLVSNVLLVVGAAFWSRGAAIMAKLALLLLVALWFGSGFTNPLPFSIGAAAGFCLLLLRQSQEKVVHVTP